MRNSEARWKEYEIENFDEVRTPQNTRPSGSSIKFWSSVKTPEEYKTFLTQSKIWMPRSASSTLPVLANEYSLNPNNFWVDPNHRNTSLVFRGQKCSRWGLSSSGQRDSQGTFLNADLSALSNAELVTYLLSAEDALIDDEDALIASKSDRRKGSSSDLKYLAWAQHESENHPGVPGWTTRLLDVSFSADVALYFATEECAGEHSGECNGRVIVFDDILNRQVKDSAGIGEIRAEIGSVWRPSIQHENMKAQESAFLITGLLTSDFRDYLVSVPTPRTAELDRRTQIGGMTLNAQPIDEDEIVQEIATRWQDISTPGIRPAQLGGELSVLKELNSQFPPVVTQSILIDRSKKVELRGYLASICISKETLFPKGSPARQN